MSSHASAPVTTSLLTVVCLALVHRDRPDWLAVGVGDAARVTSLNPERVSRLASRVAGPFADVVESLTRRGRPPREHDPVRAELLTLRALLGVASAALALLPLRKPAVRALLIGAWLRLSGELPALTKSAFCKALALPERTLRHWLAKAPSKAAPPPTPPSPTPPPRPKRPPRRPRFRFDVFLPGTQVAADTTDLCAFGVPLKLVGCQDIGGRDRSLLDSVVIDTRECADHVLEAFDAVLRDRPGIQALTDQGTPYMAAATQQTLEQLGAEHAPQKEGDPTGKSTVERAFGSLKDILAPLLSLTDTLAERLPQLRSPRLAIPFARLISAVALRAYQAGARATRRAVETRGDVSEDTLVRAAARAREDARATERSARLLLGHLHGLFAFSVSATRFIEQYRRYPLQVLRGAEASLRKRLLLDAAPDIRSIDRYFAALVRDQYAAFRDRRARDQASHTLAERLRRQRQEADAADRARRADPTLWLREALHAIAVQWLPAEGRLLFDGAGLGTGWMSAALDLIIRRHGHDPADHLAAGVLDEFRLASLHSLGDAAVIAIAAILQRELALAHARHQSDLAPDPHSAIPAAIGLSTRPDPPKPLRN
jgi:transposase InsO family protein